MISQPPYEGWSGLQLPTLRINDWVGTQWTGLAPNELESHHLLSIWTFGRTRCQRCCGLEQTHSFPVLEFDFESEMRLSMMIIHSRSTPLVSSNISTFPSHRSMIFPCFPQAGCGRWSPPDEFFGAWGIRWLRWNPWEPGRFGRFS